MSASIAGYLNPVLNEWRQLVTQDLGLPFHVLIGSLAERGAFAELDRVIASSSGFDNFYPPMLQSFRLNFDTNMPEVIGK